MAKKERHSQDIHERAMIVNAEAEVNKHGVESVLVDVVTETQEDIQEYRQHLEKITGAPVEIVRSRRVDDPHGSRNTFGFSEKGWNSPWNPPGPKKNWGPPPDPSLN